MNHLEMRLQEKGVRPGGELRGTARWCLEAPARRIELRLCWLTQGIGIPEARVVEAVVIDRPALDGGQSFSFRLPDGPLSYLGALSSLFWAVELVVLPSQECAHTVFCLSPEGSGHPILLVPLPQSEQTE